MDPKAKNSGRGEHLDFGSLNSQPQRPEVLTPENPKSQKSKALNPKAKARKP